MCLSEGMNNEQPLKNTASSDKNPVPHQSTD